MSKRNWSGVIMILAFSLIMSACGTKPISTVTNPSPTPSLENIIDIESSPEPTASVDPSSSDDPKTDDAIQVTVNPAKTIFTSGLKLGATHTHYYWEKGASAAVKNAKEIFESFSVMNNQHIMGWGADNPWPAKDQPMNFSSLDYRMALMESLGEESMITFCQAPGWMKGEDDWSMEADVLDEYIADFAKLCAAIAQRYPEVKYFQVWNEFKGYWSSKNNRWDHERYTEMYNQVYTEVKKVRPDAKVGGFYMVICGDGSKDLFGVNGTHTQTPLDKAQKTAINYWLENKAGADFICIDKGIRDYHNDKFTPTSEQSIQLTSTYEKVFRDVTELTDLPVVLSEYYGHTLLKDGEPDRTLDAAQYAGIYRNMLIGSGGRDITALLWVEKYNSTSGSLFTDTDISEGGIATKHAEVMQNISRYFAEGKTIVEASADSDEVIVMASSEKIMLVNAVSSTLKIQVNNGNTIELSPFEVLFIDTIR